jgi:hypothetical protein
MIKLIPSALSLSTLVKFGRNQALYLTSNIQINCSQFTSIKINWMILICSSTCSNQVELDSSIDITSNDLFIPIQTLSKGLYEFKLTITINDSPTLTSSSSVFIEIIQSNLITSFVPFSSSMIIHDYSQDLILDPWKYSRNLNTISFDTNAKKELIIL